MIRRKSFRMGNDMLNKSIKKWITCAITVMALFSLTACNTEIKVDYGYNPSDYVQLGQYKGIEVQVDEAAIEKGLINKRVLNDQKEKTTYSNVDREAIQGDKVIVTYTGSINGQQVSGFSNDEQGLILGTDTFIVEGFIDELYGMKADDFKIVILTVPENFTMAQEYAGSKIVFEITVNQVQAPNVPMITDTYVKENFDCDTVEAYENKIKNEIQETIDEQIEEAKKEAVLTKLQDICSVTGYPDALIETKTEELNKSINFYALMQDMTPDEYCQNKFNISFDEYVKKAAAQELIFYAIAQNENIIIKEYDYKANLPGFAESRGHSDVQSFTEKYDKDKIVKGMILQNAQDLVMNNAVFK